MSRPEGERPAASCSEPTPTSPPSARLEAAAEAPDEIIGFHGQQAAKKLLKAVLAAHGVDFPRTHSIRFLLDLLDDRHLAPPSDLHRVVELYPFGVQLRYEAPIDDEPLDRAAMRELVERLRAWAAGHVT
jgi:HEPN domain-containing protein